MAVLPNGCSATVKRNVWNKCELLSASKLFLFFLFKWNQQQIQVMPKFKAEDEEKQILIQAVESLTVKTQHRSLYLIWCQPQNFHYFSLLAVF